MPYFMLKSDLDPITILALGVGCLSLGLQFWLMRKNRPRLRIEARATAIIRSEDHGDTRSVQIRTRVFNIGVPPVTVQRVALVDNRSCVTVLLRGPQIIAEAEETSHSPGWGDEVHLPMPVPPGEYGSVTVSTGDLWPPERLKRLRIAVWHPRARLPVLARIEPPATIQCWEGDSIGGYAVDEIAA
jgi:hypothetical protein